MNLKQFKEYIENTPKGKVFGFGISPPFSWRGSYDEVAFAILETPMDKDAILQNINAAYNNEFHGYKGGVYRYGDNTDVNFEEDSSRYTDGEYCAEMIAKISGTECYPDQETKLVKLAFS